MLPINCLISSIFVQKKNSMGLLDLLGLNKKKNMKIEEFVKRGATIIDVRSPGEYQSGHVKGSKNIPLNEINGAISSLKKTNKPIITCCASGMRSGSAASVLNQHNIEVVNGGSWTSVNALV